MSDNDIPTSTVPAPPDGVTAWAPPVSAPRPRPIWGVPFVTIGYLIIVAVLVAMVWPIERYETAPGSASFVGSRLSIDAGEAAAVGVDVFAPDGGVQFVTALGSELTPLQSFMGWIDPYVAVQTCEQRFGDCDPAVSKQIQLGAMATAKEVAAFVALNFLGLDATFVEGPAQIGGFEPSLCPDDAPELRACRVLDVGDVILSMEVDDPDGGPTKVFGIDVLSDVPEALQGTKAGDVVTVTVRPIGAPDDEVRVVEVELVESPTEPGRVIVGFNPRDTRTVELPIEVDIDTDSIGGPSAGLAFTLALIDALTPGELTPPQGVAVTGTIDGDGNVGPIGALVQKAVAVRRSGAGLFLVPAGQDPAEVDRARQAAGPGVEIMQIGSLEEALAALAERGGTPVEQG
jgi:PDZ domain-containing protein